MAENKVKKIMDFHKKSVMDLAYEAGLHYQTVYAVIQGKNTTLATLRAIAHVLKCRVEDLI
jgi:DNA-binding Xre family transcriptional regulator